jgi:hypothetical protein
VSFPLATGLATAHSASDPCPLLIQSFFKCHWPVPGRAPVSGPECNAPELLPGLVLPEKPNHLGSGRFIQHWLGVAVGPDTRTVRTIPWMPRSIATLSPAFASYPRAKYMARSGSSARPSATTFNFSYGHCSPSSVPFPSRSTFKVKFPSCGASAASVPYVAHLGVQPTEFENPFRWYGIPAILEYAHGVSGCVAKESHRRRRVRPHRILSLDSAKKDA